MSESKKENQIKNASKQSIIFFDGFCILCNGFVDFLIRKDKKKKLKFASLQGETAKVTLPETIIRNIDSVVFLTKDEIYTKSKAVIHILKELPGVWNLSVILFVIPNIIRDFIYDFIAGSRYNWFEKNHTCRLPNEDEKERILP
ncbi:MAG: DUF393 domain-containing protein [Calditrichaeota bacterium]|nr:MAG: DUF393 domain-containing protein [Calditrichota bacterium]MBL1206859.1 DUF393 domain-containing protein [Calditrichota bacterium]NOG46686.1 DUF393 domain-containing protein [Calditrichota bacterium]